MLLCRLMSLNFGTSQRYIHGNLLNIHFELNKSFFYSAPPWQRTSPRYVGIWPCRHFTHPCIGLHGSSSEQRRCHSAAHYPSTCGTRNCGPHRAYYQVSNLPPVTSHHTVNHSVNFVDPVTGVHTQHVESYWNRVKLKLKSMKGCHAHQVPSYLDEFMWRERYAPTGERAVYSIMQHIANQYPV